MFEFEKICHDVEKMDPITYSALVAEKSKDVIAGLVDITEGGLSGIAIYTGLVFGAIVSDGKISEEEFLLIEPLLSLSLGERVTYDDAKAMMKYYKKDSKEYKKFVDAAVDLFGEISEDLKADIVTVCMLICGIDGKISHKEKVWLKQLIK